MGRLRDHPQDILGAKGLRHVARGDETGVPFTAVQHPLHELVGHPHRVVGVLKEHAAVRRTVQAGVVSGLDEGPGLLLLLHLAVDELHDVRMIRVEDHHLGRAPGLAAGLDDSRGRVRRPHEGNRPRRRAAARQLFLRRADPGEVDAGARAALEDHSLLAIPVEDRLHGVVYREDEAGRALGLFLDAAVEPHRAVEAGLLMHEDVRELVRKGARVVLTREVAVRPAPGRNRVHHAADELPDRPLPLGRPQLAAKILRAHHVGGHLRPGLGHLHVVLLEYDFPAFVLDGRRADLPFELVIRIGPGLGEIPPDANALCLVLALAGILGARSGRCGGRDRSHGSPLLFLLFVAPCPSMESAVSSAELPQYHNIWYWCQGQSSLLFRPWRLISNLTDGYAGHT